MSDFAAKEVAYWLFKSMSFMCSICPETDTDVRRGWRGSLCGSISMLDERDAASMRGLHKVAY